MVFWACGKCRLSPPQALHTLERLRKVRVEDKGSGVEQKMEEVKESIRKAQVGASPPGGSVALALLRSAHCFHTRPRPGSNTQLFCFQMFFSAQLILPGAMMEPTKRTRRQWACLQVYICGRVKNHENHKSSVEVYGHVIRCVLKSSTKLSTSTHQIHRSYLVLGRTES